ncbi:hypothetical protein NDU88_007098 [Pleurodeles waltl]|uniref:Uncharacterized protein n=1 Tax=Pleurodeles waltl TaxID=8319 RepID=A0AAV7U1B2_PLEWA|nr:hypothetical protein NDU88_007098 [Pleurodeles waltl]
MESGAPAGHLHGERDGAPRLPLRLGPDRAKRRDFGSWEARAGFNLVKDVNSPHASTPTDPQSWSGLAPDLHWAPPACPPWRASSWNRCLLLLVPAPGRLRLGTATDRAEEAALGKQSCVDPPLEAMAWSRLLCPRILRPTRPQPHYASRSRAFS